MKRLVVSRYRKRGNEWFVSERDESLTEMLGQPTPDANSDYLGIWSTRDQACEYAGLITRLHAEFPDKTPREVGDRARSIMDHG